MIPGLSKENKLRHCLWAPSSFSLALQRSRFSPVFSPGIPAGWAVPGLVHSCIRNAFHKHKTSRQNPKRISEATNKRLSGGYLNNKAGIERACQAA